MTDPILVASSALTTQPITVSALNHAVADTLERVFPLLRVVGEISNFTRAASGHWYFSLKDDVAQVRCAMFRGRAQYADFKPRDGDAVELRAQVRLYEQRGEFQLVVDAIKPVGAGGLLEMFNRLRDKLAAEGLFDAERKRRLPVFVRAVGVVTSLEAAALRDVIATLQARAPQVRVIVYPTPVQGEGAAQKIAAAISLASLRVAAAIDDGQQPEIDALIVCRGGGSAEDLWSFNDEAVARAIAASSVPVVVGVGHETDITIAESVADIRAPTPTGAAQLVARPRADWLMEIDAQQRRLHRATQRRWEQATLRLDVAAARLASPRQRLLAMTATLDQTQARLRRAVTSVWRDADQRWRAVSHGYARGRPALDAADQALQRLAQRMQIAARTGWHIESARLRRLEAVMLALSPQAILARGYVIVRRGDAVVSSVARLEHGTEIALQFADGRVDARVTEVEAAPLTSKPT